MTDDDERARNRRPDPTDPLPWSDTPNRWTTDPGGRDDGADWCPPGKRTDGVNVRARADLAANGGRRFYLLALALFVVAGVVTAASLTPHAGLWIALVMAVTGGLAGATGAAVDQVRRGER